MITRRGLLTSIIAAAAAPPFIRHAMPIRVLDASRIVLPLGGGHDVANSLNVNYYRYDIVNDKLMRLVRKTNTYSIVEFRGS